MSDIAAGQKRPRKEWVDVLRAMAMFYVILGHLIPGATGYFVFTSPIKIPLFFMITGYVFNYGRTDTRAFFRNLFFKLVIPWFCLTVPFILLGAIVQGQVSYIPRRFFALISGDTAWYMPCCVIAETIWFFTNKCCKQPKVIIPVASAICCFGIFSATKQWFNYAMANRALIAQFFIVLGYLVKQFEERISSMSWGTIALVTVAYLSLGVISLTIWPDKCIDIHMNKYYNYPHNFAMIVLGGLMVFSVAMRLSKMQGFKSPSVLVFLGQNTLVYYLLHGVFTRLVAKVFSWLQLSPHFSIYVCIQLVIVYVCCGITAVFLNRYLPFAVGRKSSRKMNT